MSTSHFLGWLLVGIGSFLMAVSALWGLRSLRKAPGAGIMEAAGIEPASHSLPNPGTSRGFEASVQFHSGLTVSIRNGVFVAHSRPQNFHIESLETALPKLEFILHAAQEAQRAA